MNPTLKELQDLPDCHSLDDLERPIRAALDRVLAGKPLTWTGPELVWGELLVGGPNIVEDFALMDADHGHREGRTAAIQAGRSHHEFYSAGVYDRLAAMPPIDYSRKH